MFSVMSIPPFFQQHGCQNWFKESKGLECLLQLFALFDGFGFFTVFSLFSFMSCFVQYATV